MMDLPQCWAYNSGGERCEKHAGHPGQHAITHSWTDSECASPGQPPVKGRPLIEVFAEEEAKEQASSKCVACQHQHKGGPCKCGCHEHIG